MVYNDQAFIINSSYNTILLTDAHLIYYSILLFNIYIPIHQLHIIMHLCKAQHFIYIHDLQNLFLQELMKLYQLLEVVIDCE